MSTGERRPQVTVGVLAWKCLKKNFNGITTVAMVTVALRIAALLPLRLCVGFGGKLPVWMGFIMCAAVYIAAVIPSRFWCREKMRRMVYSRHLNHRQKDIYKKWLETGLVRYARGILWGLPFLADVVYFTVFRSRLDVKTFWMPIRSLAVLAGQSPNIDTGFLVTVVLMLIFGLLFAYGWWRDLPVEYLPARSLGPKKTLHWSRRILKKHRKAMCMNTLINFFLGLPAWIALGAVLVPYAMGSVDFTLGPEMVLSQVLRLLRASLPRNVILMLAGVVLLVYVPLWLLRKTRNTALIGTLMRDTPHSSSSSSQEKSGSGSAAPAVPKVVDFHAGSESAVKDYAPPAAQASGDTDVAQRAKEAARMAQEAAEQAARLAQEAARLAQEAAQSKQNEP